MLIEGADLEVVWNGAHLNCDADLFNRSLVEPHKVIGQLSDDHAKQRSFDSRAEVLKVIARAGHDGVTLKAVAPRAKVSHTTAHSVVSALVEAGTITRAVSVHGAREYVYRLREDCNAK